ncbi:MAG TPA: alanine--tRNA ligase [Kiritimatiellia bacterium]|jgi:alanyl-tRNA synthetase
MMTGTEIRQGFLDFFKSKQHAIVPSSSLMPDAPNLLFTNAGMNQFVPIFLGQQPCPYKPGRAADTQKCIRAGGKHNDLEDVGLDTYHHTFFEMLGNWSFGDYFKKEAIEWAWELLTKVWKFPPERMYATYFGGDDKVPADEEARQLWLRFLPADHVVPGNRKDNFWMMGDTGPCGPCSEVHIDLTPGGDSKGTLVNAGSPQCIEIWNLVFIQFNANPDGSLAPLPAKHVDTGMGFERVTSMIQCTGGFADFKSEISNYKTDIFQPIFRRLEVLSGKMYGGDLASPKDIAFRVIADHIRCVGFAVADGIQPGNTDRNYVVRRILRRAVRYGRSLGFRKPFFFELVDVLAETMGDVFPEIRSRREHVRDVIRGEEEAFNRTLDRGIDLFNDEIAHAKSISGDFAFKLYDTYGFPLDLTQLMARERGLAVDTAGFEKLMEEQRARARAAQKKEVIEVSQVNVAVPTKFIGYDQLDTDAKVVDVIDLKGRTAVALDCSTCYAEMGGQVGDQGELSLGGSLWRVADTQKAGHAWLHFIDGGDAPPVGENVRLMVDAGRRADIQRHHTATHLFHWALHEVVNRDARQRGSLVAPDRLRFDFNHNEKVSDAQLADIERLVNERVKENAPVYWSEVPYAEIKGNPNIMQFFGDKYGEVVRVVQVGGHAGKFDGFSMELCGGTHARATGEIGLFKIAKESAIAAGIRRAEAVTGRYAKEWIEQHEARQRAEAEQARQRELDKEHQKQAQQAQQKGAAETARQLMTRAKNINGVPAIVEHLGDAGADAVLSVLESLKAQFKGVIVLGGAPAPDSVVLMANVSPDFVSKIQAGKIIQTIAPIVGGKGGGKPEFARGGGKDAAKLGEALSKASELLKT